MRMGDGDTRRKRMAIQGTDVYVSVKFSVKTAGHFLFIVVSLSAYSTL